MVRKQKKRVISHFNLFFCSNDSVVLNVHRECVAVAVVVVAAVVKFTFLIRDVRFFPVQVCCKIIWEPVVIDYMAVPWPLCGTECWTPTKYGMRTLARGSGDGKRNDE
jgi:hypothetical protein